MHVRAADLKQGAFVIVTGFHDDAPDFGDDAYASYFRGVRNMERDRIIGIPLLVVAVNIPFIAVVQSFGKKPPRDASPFMLALGMQSSNRPVSVNTDEAILIRANEEFASAFFAGCEFEDRSESK